MGRSSDRLRHYLTRLVNDRLPVAELSKKTGIKVPQLYRYVSGDNVPTLDNLDRIAAAIGKDPWELLKPEPRLVAPKNASPARTALIDLIQHCSDDQAEILHEAIKVLGERTNNGVSEEF